MKLLFEAWLFFFPVPFRGLEFPANLLRSLLFGRYGLFWVFDNKGPYAAPPFDPVGEYYLSRPEKPSTVTCFALILLPLPMLIKLDAVMFCYFCARVFYLREPVATEPPV